MLQKMSGWLLLSVVLVGCGQQETEQADESAPVEESTGPIIAAEASQCPVVADDGSVAIHDGLDATIQSNGYGRIALLGDEVTVKAHLWVYDEAAEEGKGEFVWESGTGGFKFQLGDTRFIDGWSPGIACMLVGEKRQLVIASELAYGERGRAPIPPNADIIYDLELMSIAEPEPGS